MLLQRGQVALEKRAAAGFVGESRLDPEELLRDRVVFLLQPLQPAVDLLEVAQHLLEARVDGVEPPVHLQEALVHVAVEGDELVVTMGQALIDLDEALIHPVEPLVHPLEALAEVGELAGQELNELLILARTHGDYLPHGAGAFKCTAGETDRSAPHPALSPLARG